jgi:hypothetical protein
MITKDERSLNLEFFFDNVVTRVKPTRNLDKIQAFIKTSETLRTLAPTTST